MEEQAIVEEEHTPTPWHEVFAFRILNGVMVMFFLAATIKLQEDDNACLWIPLFLVPAFLSSVVAVRPALSDCTWWKGWVIIHTSTSTMLALFWSIQLVRTIHAERDALDLQAGGVFYRLQDFNPFQYEEGRETFGVLIIILWMKMTSHVSRSQFRYLGNPGHPCPGAPGRRCRAASSPRRSTWPPSPSSSPPPASSGPSTPGPAPSLAVANHHHHHLMIPNITTTSTRCSVHSTSCLAVIGF